MPAAVSHIEINPDDGLYAVLFALFIKLYCSIEVAGVGECEGLHASRFRLLY